MNILFVITQILSGTISGFLTNKFAVKWLFKPISVFGHRVVDISLLSTDKKQEKFIDSIAECVEEKILTYDVLHDELCNPKMKKHIEDIISNIFESSLRNILKDKTINDLDGFEKFKDNILNETDRFVDEYISDMIYDISKVFKIEDLLTKKQLTTIINNIYSAVVKDEEANSQLSGNFESFIERTDISSAINEFLDAVDISSIEIDRGILSEVFLRYINSKSFYLAVDFILKELINLFSKSESTLYDIFSAELRDKLNEFIKELVPKAAPVIIDFIEDNRKEIDALVLEAIEKSNDSKTNRFITKIIFSMVDVPDKLIEAVDSLKNEDNDKISEKIIDFFNNNKIGTLASKLYDKTDKITEVLIQLFNKYNKSIIYNAAEYFKNNGSRIIKNYLKENEPEIKEYIKNYAKDNGINIFSLFMKNPEGAAEFLYKKIKEKEFKITNDLIKNSLKNIFNNIAEKYENRKISSFVYLIKRDRDVRKKIVDLLYRYSENNMKELLRGNVKRIVKKSLSKLNTDELLNVAMKLMSGELKYLSYFGGLLGFLIGILTIPFNMKFSTVYGTPSNYAALVLNIAVMAFIGILTNVIAICMFFRPYKRIKFLAKNKYTKLISQGIIVQNQERFSEIMGEYINEELITSQAIDMIFENNKYKFETAIRKNTIPALSGYLKKNRNSIIKKIKDKFILLLTGEKITDKIKSIKINSIIKKFKIEEKFDDYYNRHIGDFIGEERVLEIIDGVISKKYGINKKKNTDILLLFDKFIDSLDDKKIRFYTDKTINNFIEKRIKDKNTIGEILGSDIRNGINSGLDDFAKYCGGILIEKLGSYIDELKNKKSSFAKFGIKAVNPTLDYIKYKSVPYYVENKTSDIKNMIGRFIENNVYNIDKREVGYFLSGISLSNKNITDSTKIKTSMKNIIAGLRNIDGISFKNYILDDEFYRLTYPYVKRIRNSKNIQLKIICEKIINNIDIPKINLNSIFRNKEIKDIVDEEELTESISCMSDRLINETGFKDNFERLIFNVIDNDYLFNSVNNNLKEDVLNILSKSIYESVRIYSSDIINDIDFYGVTKLKIESLEPREIEALVRSFANEAFHKLYILGGFGFVFGVNSYISVIAMMIDVISDKISNNQK